MYDPILLFTFPRVSNDPNSGPLKDVSGEEVRDILTAMSAEEFYFDEVTPDDFGYTPPRPKCTGRDRWTLPD